MVFVLLLIVPVATAVAYPQPPGDFPRLKLRGNFPARGYNASATVTSLSDADSLTAPVITVTSSITTTKYVPTTESSDGTIEPKVTTYSSADISEPKFKISRSASKASKTQSNVFTIGQSSTASSVIFSDPNTATDFSSSQSIPTFLTELSTVTTELNPSTKAEETITKVRPTRASSTNLDSGTPRIDISSNTVVSPITILPWSLLFPTPKISSKLATTETSGKPWTNTLPPSSEVPQTVTSDTLEATASNVSQIATSVVGLPTPSRTTSRANFASSVHTSASTENPSVAQKTTSLASVLSSLDASSNPEPSAVITSLVSSSSSHLAIQNSSQSTAGNTTSTQKDGISLSNSMVTGEITSSVIPNKTKEDFSKTQTTLRPNSSSNLSSSWTSDDEASSRTWLVSETTSGPTNRPTSTSTSTPTPGGQTQTSKQTMTTVGITTGAVSAGIMCGIVLFLFGGWYRRRRQAQLRAPTANPFDDSNRWRESRSLGKKKMLQISSPMNPRSSVW